MPDIRNLWTWLAVVVVACVFYAGNTELKERRVETVMRQRERIAAKWPSEAVYLQELEPISVKYCPKEFQDTWREYLAMLREDITPEGQAKKTFALAHGQTKDPVEEELHKLVWTAMGYGFVPHEK